MAEMNLDDWPGWSGRKRSRGCCDNDSVLSRPSCVPPDWKIHVRRALKARELGRRLREGHPVAIRVPRIPLYSNASNDIRGLGKHL
jgi:hypothetical protein